MLNPILQSLDLDHINIAIYNRDAFLAKQETNPVVLKVKKDSQNKPLEFINLVSDLRTLSYDNFVLSRVGQCKFQCMRFCASISKVALGFIMSAIGFSFTLAGFSIVKTNSNTAGIGGGFSLCALGVLIMLAALICLCYTCKAGSSWDPISHQVAEGARSVLEAHQLSQEYTNNVRKLASKMKAVLETLKSHQEFDDHLSKFILDHVWDLGIKHIWFGHSVE